MRQGFLLKDYDRFLKGFAARALDFSVALE